MKVLADLKQTIINGEVKKAPGLTQAALEAGVGAQELMNGTLIPAMSVVGELFERQEYFIPEVLVSAKTMQECLALLRPLLTAAKAAFRGKVVMATVKGDLHDIGKNIVAMTLEGGGYEVINLGNDCPVERILQAVKEHSPQVLGLSTLLTTTRAEMKAAVAALDGLKLRPAVRVMVGGAAVNMAFADSIAADGYAGDANAALKLVNGFLGSA